MPIQRINPEGVAAPIGAYCHLAVVPAGSRLLMVSGQVGIAPDGSYAETVEAQFDQALANVGAILASQQAGFGDVVKVTYYFVERPADFGRIRKTIVETFVEGAASTLLFVAGLAAPHLKVEIEAIAAVAG